LSEDLLKLKPVLVRNCRMSEAQGQTDMLLMPEGVIKIKGTGRDIIGLCDGTKTLSEIIALLGVKYPRASRAEIQSDALDFLNNLRQKRVLDFK
jgi:pyrroloquinoline quinone biosynthesis protein D